MSKQQAPKHLRTIIFTLFVLSSLLSSCTEGDQERTSEGGLTQEEAVELVIEEIVQPETLDHPLIVFAWPELLVPGDEVGPYNKSIFDADHEPTVIREETWFFWIDDAPAAHFKHPTRFVLVTQAGGDITESEEGWWPVLNGDGLWISRDDYWDEDNWVYSNTKYRPNFSKVNPSLHLAAAPLNLPAQEGSPGSAIVINGWRTDQSGEEDMAANGDGMHDALDESGFDVTYYGPAEDENPDRDGQPTEGNMSRWFDEKSQEMQPSQTLVVFISGHGGVTKDGSGWIGPVEEAALKENLEKFDPGVHIIVVINGCYSGSFIDSLQEVADVSITATGRYDASYGDIDWLVDDPNPDDQGSEFVSGYVEDWNEIMDSEAEQRKARERAEKNGTNFWEEVSTLAYVSALEKDAAYRMGWSFPKAVRGTEGTRSSPTPTFTITPTQSPTPEPTPTESALAQLGKYLADVIVEEDQAGHAPFIKMPFKIELIIKEGSILIEGPSPWVTVSGDLKPDGSLGASGRGTVAGYNDIAVSFQGSLKGGRLEGNYTMGAEGGLPQAKPIIYGISGELSESPPATSTPNPAVNMLQDFAAVFNEKFQNADVDGLISLLHPAVLDLYGRDACQTYLSNVVDNPPHLEIVNVVSFAPWTWERDGYSILIENVYEIQAEVTAQGQTSQNTVHLGQLEDGSITWFTDCGEPLP